MSNVVSIYLSLCLSVCLSIYRSIDLSIYRSIDLSIYLSIYLYPAAPTSPLIPAVFTHQLVRPGGAVIFTSSFDIVPHFFDALGLRRHMEPGQNPLGLSLWRSGPDVAPCFSLLHAGPWGSPGGTGLKDPGGGFFRRSPIA